MNNEPAARRDERSVTLFLQRMMRGEERRETVEEGDETNKNDRTQRSKHASYMSQFSQKKNKVIFLG